MTPFLIALHVLVSIFLIAVVLLQRGKGVCPFVDEWHAVVRIHFHHA